MKRILASLFVLLTCFSASATPPVESTTDEKIALSIELMRLMNIDQTMQTMQGQMRGMMEQQFETYAGCEATQPIMREFSGAVTDQVMGYLTDDEFKVDIAAIYADVFTVEELRGIVDFYNSPLGKKLIERMPELIEKSMLITQGRMKAMLPELELLSEEYSVRIREAAKTCEQATDTAKTSSKE